MLTNPAAVRYWLLVGALACVVAALVGHAVDRGEAARRAWGRTGPVVVVTRSLEAGEPLAGATRTDRWPLALIPRSAIRAMRSLPTDARAAGPIDLGVALTSAAVQPDRPPADAARTLAIPLPDAHLPVHPGDRVDLWAARDPADVGDGQLATHRVAVGARVVAVDAGRVVVALPADRVAAVTEAAATATIALVGSG